MMRNAWKDKAVPYLLIAPFLLSFVLFFVVPSVYSILLSFAKYAGYGKIKWVGFGNYKSILSYSRFWEALARTAFYWLVKFIPVTVISFMLAWSLRSSAMRNNPLSKVFKPVLFLPQICATTAVAIIFEIMFARETGVVNQIFGTTIAWIENQTTSKWVVLLTLMWRGVGWFMVVYMSSMSAISDDLMEAARIDGATEVGIIFHITIPLMKQTFKFAFIMDAITSLRMYTEAAVLTSTSGGTAKQSAEGVINLLMVNLNSGNFGMASAYGWIIFIVIFVVSMFIFSAMKDEK